MRERKIEADCFKTWLRSQYATKIRERKKGAKPEDFDRIGTEFHRWLRDASEDIGLDKRAMISIGSSTVISSSTVGSTCGLSMPRNEARRRAGARPLQRPARLHAAIHAAAGTAAARRQ